MAFRGGATPKGLASLCSRQYALIDISAHITPVRRRVTTRLCTARPLDELGSGATGPNDEGRTTLIKGTARGRTLEFRNRRGKSLSHTRSINTGSPHAYFVDYRANASIIPDNRGIPMRSSLFVVGLAVLLVGATHGATPRLPDPTRGVIDGEPAMLFWPTSSNSGHPLDPKGCIVHLVDENENDNSYPCGTWFKPDRGYYAAWIETATHISNTRLSVSYGGGPFRGRGQQILAGVVPAAIVDVRIAFASPTGATIRVLGLRPTGYPFERRVPASQRLMVKVPAGPVVIGLFDRDGRALALSGRIDASVAGNARVVMQRPSSSQLLVVLDRPPNQSHAGHGHSALMLAMPTKTAPPDLFLDAPGRLFGIWYAVENGQGELSLTSNALTLRAIRVAVSSNTITTIRECLAIKERRNE